MSDLKMVVMGGKAFIVDVIKPNPSIKDGFYVRYQDGGTDSFKSQYLIDLPCEIEEVAQLKADKAELLEALTDISNMCIGEISMGYKLDAQSIGESIYKATGLTNPELNNLLQKHKG